MGFRLVLEKLVLGVPGGVAAVFVDKDGETIDQFTLGERDNARLVGAHQGLILQQVGQAARGVGSGGEVEVVTIRSEKVLFTVAPVQEGTFLVLVQEEGGIPSAGVRMVKDAIPLLRSLI